VLRQLGPLKPAAPAAATAEIKPKAKVKRARAERPAPREETTPPQYYGTPNIMREER
jgi:hypothetical protein